VLPIRIEAGALADGVPARDLFVSPEHALVIHGVFLPARLLVNGSTIRQVETVDSLEYFHLELDDHEVIFAERATAETFVDFGGRGMFHNAAEFERLFPDAAPAGWEHYAALLAKGEAALPGIRAALLIHAENLGRSSRDADLHLIVDGAVVRGESSDGRVHRFAVSAGAREISIASRSGIPCLAEAYSPDERRLGVPLERLVLRGTGYCIEITHDCAALTTGFYRDEGTHRWTDGCALLPGALLAGFATDVTIDVEIGKIDLSYPIETSTDGVSRVAGRRRPDHSGKRRPAKRSQMG
jgi:hypothetical protein